METKLDYSNFGWKALQKSVTFFHKKNPAGALKYYKLGGGFTYFLCSPPKIGEDEYNLTHIF